MNRRAWKSAAVVACAALASAAWGAPLIVVDLPEDGHLGATARVALSTLRSNGYEIVRFGIDERELKGAEIAAFCFATGSELRRQIGADIAEAVKNGAGIVYLAGAAGGELRDDAEFAGRLELRIAAATTRSVEARITRHSVTRGLDASRLPGPGIPYEIIGRSQKALLRQEERAIAVASEFFKGRVVVWPAEMIAAGPEDTDAALRAELLARSMAWVAGSNEPEKAYHEGPVAVPPGPATGGGTPASDEERETFKGHKGGQDPVPSGPRQPPDFSGDRPGSRPGLPDGPPPPVADLPPPSTALSNTAVVDIAGTDDDWPQLAGIIEAMLSEAGLATRAIEFRPNVTEEPLARYIPGTPSLLVIGSHRAFTPSEARAVGNHVRSGGALLAVANAQPRTQLRMVELNRILGEFGLAAKLTRPKGRAVVVEQPLTSGVGLQDIDAGIGIWGFGDLQLVTVAGESVASIMTVGDGRVFAIDGRILLSRDRRAVTEFGQLVSQVLQWLTSAP